MFQFFKSLFSGIKNNKTAITTKSASTPQAGIAIIPKVSFFNKEVTAQDMAGMLTVVPRKETVSFSLKATVLSVADLFQAFQTEQENEKKCRLIHELNNRADTLNFLQANHKIVEKNACKIFDQVISQGCHNVVSAILTALNKKRTFDFFFNHLDSFLQHNSNFIELAGCHVFAMGSKYANLKLAMLERVNKSPKGELKKLFDKNPQLACLMFNESCDKNYSNIKDCILNSLNKNENLFIFLDANTSLVEQMGCRIFCEAVKTGHEQVADIFSRKIKTLVKHSRDISLLVDLLRVQPNIELFLKKYPALVQEIGMAIRDAANKSTGAEKVVRAVAAEIYSRVEKLAPSKQDTYRIEDDSEIVFLEEEGEEDVVKSAPN